MELGVSYPTHFPAFRDRPIMPLRRLPSVSLSLSPSCVYVLDGEVSKNKDRR